MNMANQVVDVSTFQQTIDWSQVNQDGIVGAMIRAGYGFGTVDNQYRVNVTGCENNGIPYGMYHYSYATNIEDAKKEAEFFINNAKGTSPSYPLAMDVEEASQAAMGKQALTAMILAFCDMVKAAGYQPMLYTNLNWATNYIDMSQIDNAGIRVWIAQYNTTLDYKGNYFLWQYTSSGRVAGIPANVDLNYLGSDAGEITPSQPPVTDNNTYTVKAGDTLWDIAQSQLGNGSRYKEIMTLNGLTSDVIQPGQVLKLPTGNDNTGSASTYTVKAGDTLWDIAQSQLGNGSRYKEIMTLNGLTSDIIQPGQVLKLPVGGASNAGSDTTKTYTVKTGDTLWDIAQTLLDNGARYKEIVSLNNLHSSIIYPGQVLKLPE